MRPSSCGRAAHTRHRPAAAQRRRLWSGRLVMSRLPCAAASGSPDATEQQPEQQAQQQPEQQPDQQPQQQRPPRRRAKQRTPLDQLGPGAGRGGGVSHLRLLMCDCGSMEEYVARQEARNAAAAATQKLLRDPGIAPERKHALAAAELVEHGRSPFCCPGCWLLPGVCICGQLARHAPRTQVVVQMHHSEWRKTSNTGCLVQPLLAGARVLLAGHTPHDAEVAALLADGDATVAVLYPGPVAVSPGELRRLAAEQGSSRVVAIAIDANWANAGRVAANYPPDVLRVALDPEQVLARVAQDSSCAHGAGEQGGSSSSDSSGRTEQPGDSAGAAHRRAVAAQAAAGQRSLFAPVRSYAGDVQATGRVCTLEAVAALLLELEGDAALWADMLQAVRLKVDALQIGLGGQPVYGTADRESLMGLRVGRQHRGERREAQAALAAAAAPGAQAAGVAAAAAPGAAPL